MADTKQVKRPLVNYPQGISDDRFLSIPFNNSDFESYTKQVESLRETVKDMMLMVPTTDPIEKMDLINSLCRLGVQYYFENEIEEQLNHLFTILPKLVDENDYDLHTVALVFQVFRFNGYKMSCGVFSKFKDGDGNFKEEVLTDNVKGMVSLYEASHFRTRGEAILDEALAFTTKHLRLSLEERSSSISPHLRQYIENALFRPYHHGYQILEARIYISFYEQDESRNDILLKFAKYDFNRAQLVHQQELASLLRWYKEHDFKSKLTFGRHRMVESYFYSLGILSDPRYAVGRDLLSKPTCVIGFLDDFYESYSLYEEIQSFTDAIQRFDISVMDELPTDSQKVLCESLLSVIDEAENVIQKEGRSFAISYTKEEWKKWMNSELVERRWKHEGVVPTFEEYLENGRYSSATLLAMTQIMFDIKESDQNEFEWVTNKNNNLPKALQVSTRLYNDIVTNKVEEKRGIVTATTCYMKQHNVPRNKATEAFRAIIGDGWKDVNEAFMRPTPVRIQFARAALNYQRLLDVAYRDNDEYTTPATYLEQLVIKLLIDPIPLD